MGFRSRFIAGLGWRAALLLGTHLPVRRGARRRRARRRPGCSPPASCLWALYELWRYIQRTNLELARFLEAVRLGDLSQSFAHRADGSGFTDIGEALDAGHQEPSRRAASPHRIEPLLRGGARRRAGAAADRRRRGPGRARQQGGAAPVRPPPGRPDRGLPRSMARPSPTALGDDAIGKPRLVPLMLDELPQTAMVSAASVHRLGGMVRVVAVQPIQGELNAVEIAAQSDLVRVLTHEIMNSMTPVTSLAQSAAEPDGRGRHAATIRSSPTPGPRSRPSPAAPTGSCISSRATARSAGLRSSAAAISRSCPGRASSNPCSAAGDACRRRRAVARRQLRTG